MVKSFFRSIIFALVFVVSLFIFNQFAIAQEQQFNISYDTSYNLYVTGDADITQIITIENNFSEVYANSYTLTVIGKQISNISAEEDNQLLPVDIQNFNGSTQIKVSFPKNIVGKGKSRIFVIKYRSANTAQQNGQVWDVTIPKIGDPQTINRYKLNLNVPAVYGFAAYISPQPKSKSSSTQTQTFIFEKDDLVKAGVVAAFGQFQVFNFSLTYHINNPNSQKGINKIALPPDTAYQRVYYQTIDPNPIEVDLDDDGNWIASYQLEPQEKRDVIVRFSAQVFAKPQNYYPHINGIDYTFYLSPTQFWQSDNQNILQAASLLNSSKSIYDFVTSKLSYNSAKVQPSSQRLGAVGALENPDQAICTEYTDLFIALSRANGIPAREINGYAYTANPQLQPLSLVADVLHAWPEFWDAKINSWHPVDPTWEDTTGGVDYFNKFDLSHVAFAIHGRDPVLPLPGGSYKDPLSNQKDIQVDFGTLPENKEPLSKLEVENNNIWSLPFQPIHKTFRLVNIGKVALYDTPIKIESQDVTLIEGSNRNISFLAPFTSVDIPVTFKISFIPTLRPMKITLFAGDQTLEYDVPVVQIYGIQIATIFTSLLIFSGVTFSAVHFLSRLRKHENVKD